MAGGGYRPLAKSHTKIAWSVIFIAVILQVFALGFYFRSMERSITKQVVMGLVEESNKSKNYLQNMIDTKLEWMNFVSKLCYERRDDEKALWHLMEEGDKENYRIGIIGKSGNVYYGDHAVGDVSQRKYFSAAMKGNTMISGVLPGSLDGQDSICLCVPVSDGDRQIKMAIVMEYSTMEIGSYINDNTEWSNYGINVVVDSQGRMVATNPAVEGYETIYEALHAICDHKNEKDCPLWTMEEKIAEGKPGYFNCGGRQKLLLYHQPAGINDWSIVSVGRQDKYENTMIRIQSLSMGIVFATIVMLFFVSLSVLYITRVHKRKFDQLEIDEVTGVYTRAAGQNMVMERFSGEKNMNCYGCLFVDMDNFKNINDTYGHDRGDLVLRTTGTILRKSVRECDIVCRYGGDEFCVWLFGEGKKEEVKLIGKRIQANAKAKSKELRFSIGATVVNSEETDWEAILKRADEAVYEAKREGRNRMVFYDEIDRHTPQTADRSLYGGE